jgi:hypothetical protein
MGRCTVNVCAPSLSKQEENRRKKNVPLLMLMCGLTGIRSQSVFGYSRMLTLLIFSHFKCCFFGNHCIPFNVFTLTRDRQFEEMWQERRLYFVFVQNRRIQIFMNGKCAMFFVLSSHNFLRFHYCNCNMCIWMPDISNSF